MTDDSPDPSSPVNPNPPPQVPPPPANLPPDTDPETPVTT